jgi:hypothetical protein
MVHCKRGCPVGEGTDEGRQKVWSLASWELIIIGLTLFLGSSFYAHTVAPHEGERGMLPQRRYALLKGETARKRLGIPMLSDDVE